MITFRPFRNSDPPQLADIWRSQPTSRGLVQPMSAALFERHVLNSTTFEREGLIVATENDRLLGYVHAGFGPSAEGGKLSTKVGATCALMVRPLEAPDSLAGELLSRSEHFLTDHGAEILMAGGIDRWGPFYLGLTGGSECSVVLNSDPFQQAFYQANGYQEATRDIVLHCDLARFRPMVDRRLMQIRRRTQVVANDDPESRTWWESSTVGACDRTRFDLMPRDGGIPLASVGTWSMDLLGATWGIRSAGLMDLQVSLDSNRRQGLAFFLVAEALRYLQTLGMMLVEAQVDVKNVAAISFFEKLGFVEVDQAVRYRKG